MEAIVLVFLISLNLVLGIIVQPTEQSFTIYSGYPAGIWIPGPNMTNPKYGHTATELLNGDILICGGINGFITNLCDLFNHTTFSIRPNGGMENDRVHHVATLLPNGNAFITGISFLTLFSLIDYSKKKGGITPGGNTLTTTEIYSSTTAAFSLSATMTETAGRSAVSFFLPFSPNITHIIHSILSQFSQTINKF